MLSIQANTFSGFTNTVNAFNDKNYMYIICTYNKITIIKKIAFLSCDTPDSIYISNDNREVNYTFFKGHGTDEQIIFSLDPEIILKKNDEIIIVMWVS